MAIPLTPNNLFVQQGQSQVYVSWDQSSTALSYSLQRSLDNITFTSVATPTVNYFLDTTVSVNTIYYYKVAAVNGDGTSAYTESEKVVPTLPGQLSLYELRLRSQQKADRVNSQFVTLPEWNFFINQAYYELYDLLIMASEEYYVAPRLSFTTDGNQLYDLPDGQKYNKAPAFYKLYGVDVGLDSSSNAFVTLKKFDFISRNRYVYPQITTTLLGVFNMEYRLVGNQLMFIPTPAGGQQIGLWYFPRLTTLLQDQDVMDGINGWTEYVIARAAKYALDKEESDTSKLDQEILFLKDRIESSAISRDAGQPDTISNTRNFSERWGSGPGFDGPSGGY